MTVPPEEAEQETVDLDDWESVAATEREIVFGRLADLHARLAEVEELLRIAPRVAREYALWPDGTTG